MRLKKKVINDLILAEGEQIEDVIIKKTEQETVPNIFIKQQHIGIYLLRNLR